ncbi:MFS transporter [Bifidobacterium aquikefiri]|uniref:MFS transporter n=2 Tax=Bifidobacterium aquikefiri TaxID=1653207 RepID=UPI0039EB339A
MAGTMSNAITSPPIIGRAYYPALVAASTSMWAIILGPVLSTIPNQVDSIAPGNKVFGLALVTGIAGIVGIVTNPLIGHLSDRTRTRFGRRIPWLLGGMALILPISIIIGHSRSILELALWWTLLQVGANMLMAPTSATIPDVVPERHRGMASACLGIAAAAAPVLGTGVQTLVSSPSQVYMILGGLICIAQLCFITTLRNDHTVPQAHYRTKKRMYWEHMIPRSKDFWLVCAHRILFGLGQNMALAYLFYYLQDVIHYAAQHPGRTTDDGVLLLTAIYAPCVIVAAIFAGSLTDRTGRFKWCLVTATLAFAIGAVLGAVTGSWTGVTILAILTGLGYGTYASTSMTMAIHLLPDSERRARDLSLINVADLSAIALGPIAAATSISLSGYPAVFITSGILTIASGAIITAIKKAH